ncbi:MAG: hypothetical protein GTO02_01750 [Candidatus Dadabacteria bacterium]|nr:hypothetical protein [Candidatus Dadabacteria bacterium]
MPKARKSKALYYTNCYMCDVIDCTYEYTVGEKQFVMLCKNCYKEALNNNTLSMNEINKLKNTKLI